PQYTRPRVCAGLEVPEVLVSGHHENVERWRREQSERITRELRPDLLHGKE
ncbi:MAG: tRNA (guanosine(37)-N1)-methyltransferase TrmD, partial [Clostridiales bacterium]|nr:tRNA (guanosine(37)-N1)-methyltransferase TrmD [Clostridiales bacterium]